MTMQRQGDVLMVPAKLPSDAKQVVSEGDVILAYGEVTGHAHRIKESAKVQMWSGTSSGASSMIADLR